MTKLYLVPNYPPPIKERPDILFEEKYRKEDWKRFVESIDDKDWVDYPWSEWNSVHKNGIKELTRSGYKCIEVLIDIDELSAYCKKKKLKNDRWARLRFVNDKGRELWKKGLIDIENRKVREA